MSNETQEFRDRIQRLLPSDEQISFCEQCEFFHGQMRLKRCLLTIIERSGQLALVVFECPSENCAVPIHTRALGATSDVYYISAESKSISWHRKASATLRLVQQYQREHHRLSRQTSSAAGSELENLPEDHEQVTDKIIIDPSRSTTGNTEHKAGDQDHLIASLQSPTQTCPVDVKYVTSNEEAIASLSSHMYQSNISNSSPAEALMKTTESDAAEYCLTQNDHSKIQFQFHKLTKVAHLHQLLQGFFKKYSASEAFFGSFTHQWLDKYTVLIGRKLSIEEQLDSARPVNNPFVLLWNEFVAWSSWSTPFDQLLDDYSDRSLHHRAFLHHQRLKKRQPDYAVPQNVRIRILTWNVNGTVMEPFGSHIGSLDGINVVIIGLQELDISTEAYIRDNPLLLAKWEDVIDQSLGPDFVQIDVKQWVGIALFIYARESIAKYLSAVQHQHVACGFIRMFGNKGAVACFLKIYETPCLFINCHLAAFEEQLVRRNEDLTMIKKNLKFTLNEFETYTAENCDAVVLFGDLNYRITESAEFVREMHKMNKFQAILNFDQLLPLLEQSPLFHGLEEGEIMFPATYKYDKNSDNFDSSTKNRTPSWTDRILFNKAISPIKYTSISELSASDHRPVLLDGELHAISYHEETYKKTEKQVIQDLNQWENEALPVVSLDPMEIDCKDTAYYGRCTTAIFTISNMGMSTAPYEIMTADNSHFITFWPSTGYLLPGKTITVQCNISVYGADLQKANSLGKLETIVLIKIHGGRDYFLPFSCPWKRTFLGSPLESIIVDSGEMVTSSSGQSQQEQDQVRDTDPDSDAKKRTLPVTIWKIMDYLYRVVAECDLLLQRNVCTRTSFFQLLDLLDDGGDIQALENQQTGIESGSRRPSTSEAGTSPTDSRRSSLSYMSSSSQRTRQLAFTVWRLLLEFLMMLPQSLIPVDRHRDLLLSAAKNTALIRESLDNRSFNLLLAITGYVKLHLDFVRASTEYANAIKLILSSVIFDSRMPDADTKQVTQKVAFIDALMT